MSQHLPKTAALLAYDSELLSAESVRILESHLSRCGRCRRELAAIRAYGSVTGEARAMDVPDLDWSKMEFALRQAARHPARAAAKEQTSRPIVFGFVAAAAFAAAVPFVATQPFGSVDEPRPEHSSVAADVRMEGESTFAEGTATLYSRDGATRRIDAGFAIREGDRIVTGPESTLHARLEDGTGFALESSTDVTIKTLREDAIEISLTSGGVSSRVHHLDALERYEVLAGAYRAAVRGTHFRVDRRGDDVEVIVTEGAVEVLAGARSVATLRAPNGEWCADGNCDAPAPREVVLDPSEGPAAQPVAPPVAEGPRSALPRRPRGPLLSSGDVGSVVAANSHLLRACFERAARLSPTIERRAVLQVDVDGNGHVTSAHASLGTFRPLGECVERAARGFRFPAPQTPTSVRVPIDFDRR